MAVEVIVEDGSGSIANANSYVATATITEWVLTNPHDSIWATLTGAQMNGHNVMACRVLNEQINWDGWQTNTDQALDLPRSGMIDKNGNAIDSNKIPTEVKNAQCELARLLAIVDRTAESDMKGFKQIKVGSIDLIADKSDSPKIMADAVWNMIRFLGVKSVSPKGISRVMRV
jgi:hypothetical protein